MSMQLHRRTAAAIAAATLTLAAVAAAPAAATPVEVDRMQSMSGQPAFVPPCTEPLAAAFPEAEFQPQLAADPRDPERLAAVWTQGLFAGALVGVSEDGGASWQQRQVPISRCSGGDGGLVADPWIGWGADGTLHVAAITADSVVDPSRVVVVRSRDAGASWSAPVVVDEDGRRNDRVSLAVDPAAPERLHMTWTKALEDGRSAVAYATSADSGRSWTRARTIYDGAAGQYANGHHVLALPDGSVLAFFFLQPDGCDEPAPEMVLRSRDGGASWEAIEIATPRGCWPRDPDTGAQVIGNPVATVDVAPDGSVLIAWQDIPRQGEPQAAIRFARSADSGRSWSKPVDVRSGPGEAWGPTLAVDERGVIALTWYDTRADRRGDGLQWTAEVRAAHSHNAGNSWEQLRVAGPFNLHQSFTQGPGIYVLGNYFGLRPIDGGFGATFSLPDGSAAEQPQDVVFARLKVSRGA